MCMFRLGRTKRHPECVKTPALNGEWSNTAGQTSRHTQSDLLHHAFLHLVQVLSLVYLPVSHR